MRITSKGQVTIPEQVRRELGLEPGDEVEIVVRDGTASIVPVHGPGGRGQRVVEALLGRGDVDLSTDEIMARTRGEGGRNDLLIRDPPSS
ncbi:MAG: AbrB/MazE/SpoVT family DNA-binding domain-containing protein [Pseudonocardia sp.]